MELNQSQIDTNLYLVDGRYYEIKEFENSLILRARPSVAWERRIIAAVVFSIILALLFVISLVSNRWLILPSTFDHSFLPFLTLVVFLCVGNYWRRLLTNDTIWEFQKYSGKLYCRRNQEESISLTQVRALRAWQRGRKYYLALLVDGRRKLQLGSFGFSTKERAWLDDAEQIATFLEVPLEFRRSERRIPDGLADSKTDSHL